MTLSARDCLNEAERCIREAEKVNILTHSVDVRTALLDTARSWQGLAQDIQHLDRLR